MASISRSCEAVAVVQVNVGVSLIGIALLYKLSKFFYVVHANVASLIAR